MPRRALFLILLCTLWAPPARAQGTGGLLPNPISTADLIEWFEELDATKDQRAQILALHDEYLAKCRELREGRIQALLNAEKSVQPLNPVGWVPDESDLRRFVRELESIQIEIDRLDRDLVESTLQVFPDLHDTVEELRCKRNRTRLLSDPLTRMWIANAYLETDLGRAAEIAKLAPEEMAAIEPHLLEYEQDLIGELERLARIAHAHLLEYREALDQAGMRHDPEASQGDERQEERVQIWTAMSKEPGAQARKILRSRNEAIAKAAEAISPEAGHRFRTAFLRSGAGVAGRNDFDGYRLDFEIEKYLERGDVSDEERARLIDIRDRYHQQWIALYEEMLEATIECYGGTSFIWSDEMHVRQAEYQTWTEDWVRRCQSLAQTTRTAITSVIGPEQAAEMTAAYDRWREELAAKNRENESDQVIWSSPAYRRSGTQTMFLPPQITRADFDFYVDFLGLTDSEREPARNAFEGYLEALRNLALRELGGLYYSTAWLPNEETGELEPPPVQNVEAAEGNRTRFIRAMEALHEQFLDALRSVRPDDAHRHRIGAIALHRDLRLLAEHEKSQYDYEYTEARANLIDAILKATISEAARNRALAIATDRRPALRAALSRHLESQRALLLENYRAQFELAPLITRRATTEELLQTEAAQRQLAAADAVIQARNAVVDLNRATLAEIEAALSEREAVVIRLAYLRSAYPALFDDPFFDEAMIPRAMALPGLADQQTIDLAIVEWDHAQAYAELSMQMCEIRRHSPWQGQWGSTSNTEFFNDRKTRQEQIDCLRFYRDELNHRARLKVQDILAPEQWAALTSATTAQAAN